LKNIYKNLTFQVLLAIITGIIVGHFTPDFAQNLKPVGDTFINLIKLVIAPIIFLTIVIGIANMGNLKKVGRVGGKAILYFEIVTTLALIIGLIVANVIRPGDGINFKIQASSEIAKYQTQANEMHWVDFFLHIIPSNIFDAFAKGDILQILFFSVLFGVGLSKLGTPGQPIIHFFEKLSSIFFNILSIIMKLAPLGAFGGMAFTIGKYGLQTLLPLSILMLSVYTTMFLFIFVVLNLIARYYKFSLWRFLVFIKEEILIVLGTSSSESVLPRMMVKLEKFGCSKTID
jgi:aerobic C4-dicarboxylate transport protein